MSDGTSGIVYNLEEIYVEEKVLQTHFTKLR